MRITWVRHAAFEGLGTIARWAQRRGHELTELRPFAGDALQSGPFDLLVVMGGPMGAADTAGYPWLADERTFVREAAEGGKAVLGVCLGAQVLADALGGAVSRNPEREIGWADVTLTEAGRACPVLGVLPETFDAFHWHGDTFAPPPDVPSAATSAACANQAFSVDGGRVVGLQFHLEPTLEDVAGLVRACGADLMPSAHVWSAAELLSVPPERYADANAMLERLLDAMAARVG